MTEYTAGGWMPPQQPSFSCRSMIQRAAVFIAARRSLRGTTLRYWCRALSRRWKTPSQLAAGARGLTGLGSPASVCSSSSGNGAGRTGRFAETMVSGTIVCRAQQPKS